MNEILPECCQKFDDIFIKNHIKIGQGMPLAHIALEWKNNGFKPTDLIEALNLGYKNHSYTRNINEQKQVCIYLSKTLLIPQHITVPETNLDWFKKHNTIDFDLDKIFEQEASSDLQANENTHWSLKSVILKGKK